MFITTSARADAMAVTFAQALSERFHAPFVPRKKQSLNVMQAYHQSSCLVVHNTRIELHIKGEKRPFFFHPNSASLRMKRILKGEVDPLLQVAQVEQGDTILDCTLGLASDSIVLSYAAGEKGKVIGVEGNEYIAFIVKQGLANWSSALHEMNLAMRRIDVIQENYMDKLVELPDRSVDIVYFDPMFDEAILSSDGIQSLRSLALHQKITQETMIEAKRIARKRVILKNHFRSESFSELGFSVNVRKSSKFHFGYIQI
ncbi:class I SAM-dependent methyltransferase [Bacillus spongiae]|uniref:Class I SAM-dependent methyltransferase n=1 Tax=Bacillus spongiae TaxID=2683610 RepID=A0ABU8HDZ9_9BACI